jgi:protein involved in polysaccharide export with SLBB domain
VQLIQGGEASFPLNGPVNLAGQTLREAESAVTALYNADYLVPVVRAEATPIGPCQTGPRDPR